MLEKLKVIINTVLINKNIPKIKTLKSNLKLRDDLGLDSLDLAELTVRIENQFGIDIFENGIVNTIGEIINILEKKNVK